MRHVASCGGNVALLCSFNGAEALLPTHQPACVACLFQDSGDTVVDRAIRAFVDAATGVGGVVTFQGPTP